MPSLRWFGSSGIRGPTDEVHVTLGLRLGRALGATYRHVIVGRDARRTGPALEMAVVAGLTASGASVTRAGILPTPALAYHARRHDLGVQVTASHNPAPDNGYKLWTPQGASPEHSELERIEATMDDLPEPADWRGVGDAHTLCEPVRGYRAAIDGHLASLGLPPDALAGTRIALDCAHGAGALATPTLLSGRGARLSVLGGSPDGRFPDHPSEPTAQHLESLSALLRSGGHAFGVAHDGDADRTVFLGPDGALIQSERLLAVLAETRGDTRIALPVDASGVVRDHLPDAEIVITPVGDIHLSRAVQNGRATIGCEPSGTWFFADWSPTPEGPYAATYVSCLLATQPELLDRVAALPAYARRTHKTRLPRGLAREDALRRVTDAGHRLADAVAAVTTSAVDGLRTDTDDGWVLVRPSGTEPVVRITAEAQNAARAEALVAAAVTEVANALEGA